MAVTGLTHRDFVKRASFFKGTTTVASTNPAVTIGPAIYKANLQKIKISMEPPPNDISRSCGMGKHAECPLCNCEYHGD